MQSPFILKVATRLLPFAITINILAACGSSGSKGPSAPPAQNPGVTQNPGVSLVGQCEGMTDGQVQDLKLYHSEFAKVGQTCADLAFDGKVTCSQGKKSFQDNASPSCEETELKTLTIISPKNVIELGQSLALSLEGVDQRNGKITVSNDQAKWTSSNDLVTVTNAGIVSGTVPFKNAVIKAKVGSITAEYTLSVIGKNCADTVDGDSKEFTRYKKARVAFNVGCEAIKVQASCKNGTFAFPENTSETCEVAKLTQLITDPAALYLNRGDAVAVSLFLVDDIGTRAKIAATEASWELPAGGLVKQENGTITALTFIPDHSEIKVSAQGVSGVISLNDTLDKPELTGFSKDSILMKVGDEQTLEVHATRPLDLDRVNWESSDPTTVSVVTGKIKALKADSTATISAKLNGKVISIKVNVEAALSIDLVPVVFDDSQEAGKVHPLTQDKLDLFPAYIATAHGLIANQKPELSAMTDGCKFTLRQSRDKWEINVQLDDTLKTVPANCESDLLLNSAAGQKIVQKIKIPVDYNKVNLIESTPQSTDEGMEVGKISLKFSSSYSVTSAEVKSLADASDASCDWSLAADDAGYRVLIQGDGTKTCAAQIVIKMLDTNDRLTLTFKDVVVASNAKPFADLCTSTDNLATKATVSAVRKEFGPSMSCEVLARLIRVKNMNAMTRDSEFALALNNLNLTDLSPLSRMIGLKELSLVANRKLSDIAPLSDLKLLQMLDLKFTAVTDFAPIFKHTEIADLRLPAGVKIACSPDITNPEITKICK